MSTNARELRQFGANVRHVREQLGLSQEVLAQRCELHRTYVGGIERGERNPSLLNILRIAKALGQEPAALLKEVR
ncbi:MAG: helix-turn-helix transcriptional regulator [Phycisphaerae bacterium]|nr:helix-turn-helix transcriptional regulator [Phycisphaerae bacterium]